MENGRWKMEEGRRYCISLGRRKRRPYSLPTVYRRGDAVGVGPVPGLARFWLATLGDKQFIGWLEF